MPGAGRRRLFLTATPATEQTATLSTKLTATLSTKLTASPTAKMAAKLTATLTAKLPTKLTAKLAATLAVLTCVAGWAVAATAPASAADRSARRAPVDTVTAFTSVTGTGTVLEWDAETLERWKAAGVTVAPAGTAASADAGAEVDLPITSGYVESHSDHSFKPRFLLGSIEHYGSGLTFSTPNASVEATDLVFDLGESMVYGTIGATEDVPLFSLQQRDLHVVRSGHTLQIEGAQLDLAPTGAAELDAIFHTSAIVAGAEIAAVRMVATGKVSRYSYTEQTTEFPRLSGIALSLTFTAHALAAFRTEAITPSATGSASYDANRAEVSFPVTGGTAVVHPNRRGMPGSLGGVVLGWGTGLSLNHGSASVALTDLTMVPAVSTIYTSVDGGADNGALFAVKLSSKHTKSRLTLSGGNLNLKGALLDLTATGAETLDHVFGTTEWKAGAELGKLSLVASGG